MATGDQWSGRAGFIAATIGSAVGLGSIWKFPYEVGTNGGSAFVFCYLFGLALVVFPLMLAEFALGRQGQADPETALSQAAAAWGHSRAWRFVGSLGVGTGFLILSYYAVIGGWTLNYAVDAALGHLEGLTAPLAERHFAAFLEAPLRMLFFHAFFLALTATIVGRGIEGGIELACKVLMPVLIGVITLLAAVSLWTGAAGAAVRFLFQFDVGRLSARGALEALGLGFFSIGVGLGLMITYAAYARPDIDLPSAALATIVGDTVVSVLAGLAIFPIVFATGLDPAGGPGLMFVTLPVAFGSISYGRVLSAVFYLLLALAALASAMALLELSVAWLKRHTALRRPAAALVSSILCWAVGVLTVLSFNVLASWRPLAFVPGLENANAYEAIDHVASNTLLPIGGVCLSLFAGWVVPGQTLARDLGLGGQGLRLLRIILRYIAPGLIVIVTLARFVLDA